MPEDMVIFARTYDLVTWLIPRSLRFARSQRFVVTKRLQDAILDFQERLIEGNSLPPGRGRHRRLCQADADLQKVRLYLRLAARWEWLSHGQTQHVSSMVAEVGRLLGGWLRRTARETSTRSSETRT